MLLSAPHRDIAVIDRLQRAAFDYFLVHSDAGTGLVADTARVGSPASIAATGFGLSCYPVAVERGWMERTDAARRVLAILRFLDRSRQASDKHATGYRGFYYHFLDMRTGERRWNSELSTIDTALLLAGMLTAAAYFCGRDPSEAEIRSLAARLHERADWAWALNRGDTVTMGWRPPGRFLKHRWRGYSEALLLYVLALGASNWPIAPESYGAYAAAHEWLTIDAAAHLHAGALFIHLFPHAWIDFRGIRDTGMREAGSDYFENTRRAIALQRTHAEENPHGFFGYCRDLWGFSACHAPKGWQQLRDGRRQKLLGYAARGAPFGADDGTVVPWAPLAGLPFAPDDCLSGLFHLLAHYPALLRDARFPGGFNPSLAGAGREGWVDDRIVGLDQGLSVMMIENWRSGLIWELTRSIPVFSRGLRRAGFEGGWLTPGVF
ncbi:glucoamylase family protein [Ensifer sp. BR816]|uniref:glucoamylase family protein n=1 Tax=Rhizobium sp. (strain BR816) TaxID=1057002 RepID=UPI000475E3A4|nr:glucoamylase family protein [Ensifer sp. BR816]